MCFVRDIPIFFICHVRIKISPVFINIKKCFPTIHDFFICHFHPNIAIIIDCLQNRHFINFRHIGIFNQFNKLMAHNEDLDYFSLCSTLNSTPELMSFKLYSLTKRGQAYHMPMEIQSNFLAK